jgi:hypothetical protein
MVDEKLKGKIVGQALEYVKNNTQATKLEDFERLLKIIENFYLNKNEK